MSLNNGTIEYNFDGLVGPTHNYAGLAFGNVASECNAGAISSPKQAALQGLHKMRLLMNMGIAQAVLPPQQRPNLDLLRTLGFSGDNAKILQQVYKYQPALLVACYSSASMWAANMATVSPSCDTKDGLCHVTPANLTTNLHRAQEAEFNHILLETVFSDPNQFMIHPPITAWADLSDEGAANHSVLCSEYGTKGLEMFVYGKTGVQHDLAQTIKYPARQTKLASATILRQHMLDPEYCIVLQQNPLAIDAGVFHNDVIFVANKSVLLYHQAAFVDDQSLKNALHKHFTDDLHIIEISADQLSLAEAVATYFFNSQLVSLPNSTDMLLLMPMECKQSAPVQKIVQSILAGKSPIKKVEYVDCRESMRNGGGPACLRLRVIMTPSQQQAVHPGIIMTNELLVQLENWIKLHYRDSLSPTDLLDPLLINEVNVALDQLTQILQLGSIYSFQQDR